MRQSLAALAAIGALAAVPLSVSGALAASPPAKRHHHHRVVRHHHHKPRHHSCIPQHNRGDHDADNRGGPSDGDGCM